jgi:hypothetical protein
VVAIPTVDPTPTSVPTPATAETESTEAESETETESQELESKEPETQQPADGTSQLSILPQVTQLPADNGKVTQVDKPATASAADQSTDATSDQQTGSEDSSVTEIEIPVASEPESEPEDIVIDAGEGASWTIPGVSGDAASQIDMSVTFGTETIPVKAIDKLKTDDYMTMSLAYDGPFGFDAKLTVNTGTEHAGKFANLYYYNPDRDKLELTDSVKTDINGDATFNMKHASDYVITFTDKQMIAQNGSNTMLFIILAVILAGGVTVLAFVIYKINKAELKDDDYYFDLDDDR